MKTKNPKRALIAAGIALAFMAGRHSVGDTLFWQGYDTAMNHVRTTISAKMPELVPFYMMDLGIKFIPRGNNIVGIKYVGSGTEEQGPGTRVQGSEQKHLTLNVEHGTLNGSREVLP